MESQWIITGLSSLVCESVTCLLDDDRVNVAETQPLFTDAKEKHGDVVLS